MAKIYEQENSGGVNIIAKGTTFIGNIVAQGDCRIDGAMKGNIQSKSKIIIGQSGIVEGEIVCTTIEIEGRVKANISTTEQLSLRSTAILEGNIIVNKIAIEPGARFDGSCKMGNSRNVSAQEPTPET